MNWKGFGRKRSQLIPRYHPVILSYGFINSSGYAEVLPRGPALSRPIRTPKPQALRLHDHASISENGTATRLRGSNPGRGKRFITPSKRPDRLWAPPSLQFTVHRVFFPRVKQPRREPDRSLPSRVEAENEWSYTSPSIRLHDVLLSSQCWSYPTMVTESGHLSVTYRCPKPYALCSRTNEATKQT